MPAAITEAAATIEERIKELRTELAQLEKAKAALDGVTGARRQTGSSPSRRRPRATARRGGRVDRGAELKALLAKNPLIRPTDAAREMGISSQQVHGVIKRLRDAGELERTEKDGFRVLS